MTNSKVYVQGSFDILHEGHIKLLKRASKLGDLYIGVIIDRAYVRNRGYFADQNLEERMEAIKNLNFNFIKDISPADNLLTSKYLIALKPDFVVVGSDWAEKDIYTQYDIPQSWLDERNIELIFFPYTRGISSTQLKNDRT